MHELSVANSILDIVCRHVPAAQGPLVRAVRVRVGDGAGVLPDSLEFCFEAIVAGTPYASARLAVDRVTGDDLRVVDVEVDDGIEVAS